MAKPDKKQVIAISLRKDQMEFLTELNAVSGISKAEIIRQALDKCAPDLMGALEAMKQHGFRPATKTERKASKKKTTKKASKGAAKKWDDML